MNILPRELREQVALLRAAGVGVRELSRELGVARQTVSRVVGAESRYPKEVMRLVDALYAVLDAHGLVDQEGSPADITTTMGALHGYVLLTCPLHPDEDSDAQFDSMSSDFGCVACRSEGLKRHHERRKADGLPIVPPWRREGAQPNKKRVCRKCGEVGHFAKTCRANEPAKPASLPDWRSI